MVDYMYEGIDFTDKLARLDYIEKQLRQHISSSIEYVANIRVSKKEFHLSFTYFSTAKTIIVTENKLFLEKALGSNQYSFRLVSKTRRGTITRLDEADVWETASFIRHLVLQYSAISGKEKDSYLAKEYVDGNKFIYTRLASCPRKLYTRLISLIFHL